MSTDDSPERDLEDSEGLPSTTLEHEESTSNPSYPSNLMEDPKPSQKPRREVWWLRLDLGATNHSLKSIGRCYEESLNWFLLSSSSNSLLRHVRSPKGDNLRRDLHQCPGYLREEITLTCDLTKSAVVSHSFPAPSERCSICHQLVQYTSIDLGSVDSLSSLNNSLSLPPTEGAVTGTFDDFAPLGGIDPFTPTEGALAFDDFAPLGVESSDASFVLPSLEAHFLSPNLQPFSQLEAVAVGKYKRRPLSPMIFTR